MVAGPSFDSNQRGLMNNLTTGSFPLFRIAGIQVYLHWSWLLVAYLEIVNRVNKYHSMTWNVIEYVARASIVLLHEFGHARACRASGKAGQPDHALAAGRRGLCATAAQASALLWSIASCRTTG